MSLDIISVREEFEILREKVHGKPLVYLDSAATTLKPRRVCKSLEAHYSREASNVHRGVHLLSEKATTAFEEARQRCQKFIGASSSTEIVFTAGTTAAINTVAQSLVKSKMLNAGDKILVSQMEHHSNIVPWQMIAESHGLEIVVLPMDERGQLRVELLDQLLTADVKLVAVTMVSNAIGTVNPVAKIVSAAKKVGAYVLFDAAQSVAHFPVDVQKLDCDFLAFSGHKLCGPTGVGVLYGKKDLLTKMEPVFGGGGMIRSVSFAGTTYGQLPDKFEGGTPHIAGAIALGEAIRFMESVGLDNIAEYESQLTTYGQERLSNIDGLEIIGTAEEKVPVFSFKLEGVHPHDIGSLLDQDGIAIRAGHHCCQPLMEFFEVPATSRASLSFYNTPEEIDHLVRGIANVKDIFK